MAMMKETYEFCKKLYKPTSKPDNLIPIEIKDIDNYLKQDGFFIWTLKKSNEDFDIDYVKDLGEEKQSFIIVSFRSNKYTCYKTTWLINNENSIYISKSIVGTDLNELKDKLNEIEGGQY